MSNTSSNFEMTGTLLGQELRKRKTPQEKIAIIQQTMEPSMTVSHVARLHGIQPSLLFKWKKLNRPGFPGEYFICELRLPDHCFRWKHNKLFLLLPEEYGPAFPAIVDCYTSPPTLVWPAPLLSGFSSSYGVLPPLCKDH